MGTSQALREGQTKIRKKLNEGKIARTSLPGGGMCEVPEEWYLSYSSKVLTDLGSVWGRCGTDQPPTSFGEETLRSNLQQTNAHALARAQENYPGVELPGTHVSKLDQQKEPNVDKNIDSKMTTMLTDLRYADVTKSPKPPVAPTDAPCAGESDDSSVLTFDVPMLGKTSGDHDAKVDDKDSFGHDDTLHSF